MSGSARGTLQQTAITIAILALAPLVAIATGSPSLTFLPVLFAIWNLRAFAKSRDDPRAAMRAEMLIWLAVAFIGFIYSCLKAIAADDDKFALIAHVAGTVLSVVAGGLVLKRLFTTRSDGGGDRSLSLR